jgi:hypothetical protein
MRTLPPVVGGVDGQMLKLESLDGVDFEFLGYLLSCHLVIEHYLDEFLMTLGTKLRWNSARLTFSQKLKLFPPELFPDGAEVVSVLRHLNGLRNKVAHNIRAKPADLDLKPLADFFRAKVMKLEEVPADPIELLEAFTLMICSGFMGWIASDAYRTTWRNEREV